MSGSKAKMIPFSQIDMTTIRNPRTDLGDIDELVESLRNNGQIQAVAVRQQHFGGNGAASIQMTDKTVMALEPTS